MQTTLTEEKLKEICDHLANTAEMIGFSLSLDLGSIETIENILDGLKQLGDESALRGAEYMCGIYIGEIFRNNLNGKWVFDEKYHQDAVDINGTSVFPVAKVRKFVSNPESDGLVFYAQAIFAKGKG